MPTRSGVRISALQSDLDELTKVDISSTTTTATISTEGTKDMILNTNEGTDSGRIIIYDGSAGDIGLDPKGDVVVNDGDIQLKPTTTSTAHIKTTGSLDVRCTDNMRLGTDLADSIRIGRDNSTGAKVHIRSGSDDDLVVSNGKVGIGMSDPSDALEIDGDIQLTPTASSTAHVKTTGSVDIRASGNVRMGTDGADSVRIGRDNTTAAKVHVRSGDDTDLVVTNSKVGLGTETPGTQLQLEGTAPYVTLKNSTAENTAGGCESKIIFEDHADVTLAQVEGSHSGSSDDTKGKMILSTHTGSALTAAVTIDDAQDVTFAADVTVTGDIVLDDGGSLKEAGGTAAITFDGSGHVTKIGQDTHTSGQFLKWDGSKAVWDAAGGGAIDGVANGADNRIATFSSSDELNGEANLEFDGTDLSIAAAGKVEFRDANIYIQSEEDGHLTVVADDHVTIDGTPTLKSDLGTSATTLRTPFDASLDATGEMLTFIDTPGGPAPAHAALTPGKMYWLSDDPGWHLVDSDDDQEGAAGELVAIALNANASSGDGMLLRGMIRLDSGTYSGTAAVGAIGYMDGTDRDGLGAGTAGFISFTKPTASGRIVRVAGHCLQKDGSNHIVFYFNPSNDYVEIA